MTPNASGRPNRVAPDGSTHAVADRGRYWGNRGRLLNARGEVARHHLGRNWIVCVLEFHGRHRTQWTPNRLTELYFLDEPTAFAAGHRPCGECRYHDYQRFTRAWALAHPDDPRGAREIDRRLHADRIDVDGVHRTFSADLAELPDGVMIAYDDGFWLVLGAHVHRWSMAGYDASRPRSELPDVVIVLTPRATVATLRAGYDPDVHPSASDPSRTIVGGSTPSSEGQVP
ncbi:hypothetical protein LQ327_23465 [Actinomycetospora endophytica]|uniref:Uncharacterized protein n=1 Tax=Actinomycetospora endophytica TaxID=2291215 RepID=A0ABS8PDI4_9PSEU|nr:hypothetical protein [Actinomycetospora endophytica]MCD2196337.1 hypothetical protein [Actinomycetospora endophytica]